MTSGPVQRSSRGNKALTLFAKSGLVRASLPRLLLLASVLLMVLANGCVSKSKARLEAQKAYIAGQQAGMARMQQTQNPSVTINGQVRNSIVPWTEGLTVTKALAAAEYYGRTDPAAIIVVHNGIGRRYEPKQVLTGPELPLTAGDMVQIIPQSGTPRP
jgi:hypothetical protein